VKILRDTFELAKAAAEDSEVPLWLVGNKDTITDIVLSPWSAEKGMAAINGHIPGDGEYMTTGITPGQFCYGKVITRNDRILEDCLNLVEEKGEWRFVDDFGEEVRVEIVEQEGDDETAEEKNSDRFYREGLNVLRTPGPRKHFRPGRSRKPPGLH
jgi:hypothetical protein